VAESLEAMSPADLLAFLEKKLNTQVAAIAQSDAYYNGEHRLAFATAKFREAFARYFPPLAVNWMKVVVDTPASRLTVQGFRFEPDSSKPTWEMDDDSDAWGIWQASNMDSGSGIVHTDAIKYGLSYVMVMPPEKPGADDATGLPRILPEHPNECLTYCDPADRTTRLCAIKRWTNEIDGFLYANVFTADSVFKFKTDQPLKSKVPTGKHTWSQVGTDDNPIGLVPIIAIENKPDLEFGGRSDLEEAIPIQDSINKYCLDMQVSSEFHAYPQRYATGWETPTDEGGEEMTGRQVELKMGSTRLLTAEDPQAKFGSLAPGDVQNYISPIETFIDMLASVTATPGYALKAQISNLSADAMHAADTGLVDRCRRKIDNAFSDNWEDTMRCCFASMNDKRSDATTAEVIWKDPERRSISQSIDAAVKMRVSLSVPIEMCWEVLGWSPQQIRMARDMMNLPPGGPGNIGPASDNGDVTVNEATGRPVGEPIILGPNGQPLPAAQQPAAAGGTQPAQTPSQPIPAPKPSM
jgi:hypothetical protein